MATKAVSSDKSAATPLREIIRGILWLLGTALAVRFVETLIGRSPLGAALAGAVVVDLAMTRAGLRWDERDDLSSKDFTPRLWRQIGIGVAVGSALVLVPFVILLIVGAATISPGTPSLTLLFGVLRGAADGVRDELLYRGWPLLVAARAGVPVRYAIAYAALAGATPIMLVDRLSWETLLVFLAQGVLFAMLWVRTNAAWSSVAAHATWFVLAGVGIRGALVETSWNMGLLAENARIRGVPAIVCFIVTVLLTVIVSKKIVQSSEAPHGHAAS